MFRNASISLAIFLTAVVIGLIIERSITPKLTAEHIEQATLYGEKNQLTTPPRPFHFDGCTLFPDRIGQTSFLDACLTHDIAYWYSGSTDQRHQADQVFQEDIRASGPAGVWLHWPMYVAVRVFGDTWILRQFDANWGFGYNQ